MRTSATQACLLITVWHCAERTLAVALLRQPRLLVLLAYYIISWLRSLVPLRIVDFGPGTDVNYAFTAQTVMNPLGKSPPMCSEF